LIISTHTLLTYGHLKQTYPYILEQVTFSAIMMPDNQFH
jgi:hypothetical protein